VVGISEKVGKLTPMYNTFERKHMMNYDDTMKYMMKYIMIYIYKMKYMMKYMMTYVMLMKYMMKHLMKYDYISQPVDLDGFGLWSCTREFSGQRPAFGLQ
jgi:hypothetical protein